MLVAIFPAFALSVTVPRWTVPRRELLATSTTLLLPATARAAVVPPREVETSIEVRPSPAASKVITVKRPRFTGAGDPAWTFMEREVSSAVFSNPWPSAWPFSGEADFRRLDEAPDPDFYAFPKLVYHIDEGAVAALTRFYDTHIEDGSAILDICSSWVSHYPRGIDHADLNRPNAILSRRSAPPQERWRWWHRPP